MTVNRQLVVTIAFVCLSILFTSATGQAVTCDTNSPGDVTFENFSLDCPNGFNIQSGGTVTINVGTLTASSISITAAADISITSFDANVDANVDIVATNDLIQTDVSITSSTGDFTISASVVTGDNVNLVGNLLVLSADADISIQNGLLDFAASVQLDASTSITLDSLDIQADVDVDVSAVAELSLNNLAITATGDITLAGISIADVGVDLSGTTITITANDRDITLDVGSILATALQLNAAANVNVAGTDISVNGAVDITAADLISLDSDVTINADVNDITLSANVISAVNLSISGASVSIDALSGDVSITGSIDADALQVNAAANIDLSELQVSVSGDVSLNADVDIIVDTITIDATGNIVLNAQSLVGSSLTIANALDVTLSIDGDINIDLSSINADGVLDLLSNTDISISGLDVTLTGNVNITANLLNSTDLSLATSADISINVPSLISANIALSGNDISVSVDGVVSLDSGSIDAAGSVTIDATADIELLSIDISAEADVLISAADSVLLQSSLSVSTNGNISLLARLISGINLSLSGVEVSIENTEATVASTVCLSDPLSALENLWPNGSPASGIYLSVADIVYAQLTINAAGNDCIGLFANAVVETQVDVDSLVNIVVSMDSSRVSSNLAAMVWIDTEAVVHANWNVVVDSNNIGILLQTQGATSEIVFGESLSIDVEGRIALQVDTAVVFDTVNGVINAVGSVIGALLDDVTVTGDIEIQAERILGTVAGVGLRVRGDLDVDGGNLVVDASVAAQVLSTLNLVGVQLDSLVSVSNDANVQISGLVSPPTINAISVRVNDIEVLDTSSLSINELITDVSLILSQDSRVVLTGSRYEASVDASLSINAATDKITALLIPVDIDLINVDLTLSIRRLDDIRALDTVSSVAGVLRLTGSTLDIDVSASATSSSIGEICVLTSNIEVNALNSDIIINIDGRVHAITNVVESVMSLVDSVLDINVRASSEITNGLNNLELSIENSNISVAISCSQGTCVGINFNEISLLGDADISISASVTGACPLGACSGILGNTGASIDGDLNTVVTLSLLGVSAQANVCPNCVGIELPDVEVSLGGSIVLNGEGTTGILLGDSNFNVDVVLLDGSSILSGVSFAEFGFGVDLGTASFSGSLVHISGFSETQADLFMDDIFFDFSSAASTDCGAVFELNGNVETQNVDINVNAASIFNNCGVIFSGFASVEVGLAIDADVTFVNGINSNGGISINGILNISGELCGLFESNSLFISDAILSSCDSRTRALTGLDIVSDVLSIADLNGSNSLLPLNIRTRVLNILGVQIGLNRPIPSADIEVDVLQSSVDVSARDEEASLISVEGNLNVHASANAEVISVDGNTNLEFVSESGTISLGSLDGPLASLQIRGNSALNENLNLGLLNLGEGIHDIRGIINGVVNLNSRRAVLSGTTKTSVASVTDLTVDTSAEVEGDVSTRVLNQMTSILPEPVVVDMERDTGLLHVNRLSLQSDVRLVFNLLSSEEYSRLLIDNIVSLNTGARIEIDVEDSQGNPGENFFVLGSNTDLRAAGLRSVSGELLQEFSVIQGNDGEEYVVSFQIQPEVTARRAASYMSLHKNSVPYAVEDSCYAKCDMGRLCTCCVNLLHNDFDDDPLDQINAQLTALPPGRDSRFVLNPDGNLCYTRPATEGMVAGDEYFSASYRVIDSPGDKSVPAPINFRLQTSDPSAPSSSSSSPVPVPASSSPVPVPASSSPVPVPASSSPVPVPASPSRSRAPAPVPASPSAAPSRDAEDDDDFVFPSPSRSPFVPANDDDDETFSATTFSYFSPVEFSSQFDDDDESFSSASSGSIVLPLAALLVPLVAILV